MTAITKDFYKQVRKRIALVLAVMWIGGWYVHLDAVRVQEIQQMQACKSGTGFKAMSCAGVDFILPSESLSSFGLFLSMTVVVLFSPLVFLPAGYLARRYMAYAAAREIRQEEAARAQLQRQQQQESAARIAQNEAESDAALRQISRSEVIHKLGSINDLADLLPAESDEERMMNIRHGVAQALRELAAKYTVTELAGLIKSDPVIEHTVRAVVERLDGSSLRTIVEIQALRIAAQ